MKKVLNVGGSNREIPLPSFYAEFEQILLDIDPKGDPDILCDARQLHTLESGQFDAVYCSHNLEHYFRHDVPEVLAGFLHVLNENGFAHIVVPDILETMREALAKNLDLDDAIYQSAAGPILVVDVLYGYHVEIERSGQDFYAHKTGFSMKSLTAALLRAGFSNVYGQSGNLEIRVLAFKRAPDQMTRAQFGLPAEG